MKHGGFTRGQVTWALWQTFAHFPELDGRRAVVPKAFATRVRKMNELGVPFADEEKPGQPGIDIRYDLFHSFQLLVALVLQDNGIKQGEAAHFVRESEEPLYEGFIYIAYNPPRLDGQDIPAKERPGTPRLSLKKDVNASNIEDWIADTTVYLSFRYVEIKEAWDEDQLKAVSNGGTSAAFFAPKVIRGVSGLSAEMREAQKAYRDPIRVIVELSGIATLLRDYLNKAPEIRRGRR